MSNIVNKRHNISSFLNELFSYPVVPQKAEYIHNNNITITIQYIPGDGFVVGYQDKRVPVTVNPVMMFSDAHYHKIHRKKHTADSFRDAVMNLPILNSKTLGIKGDNALDVKINIERSKLELHEVLSEVCMHAEMHYNKNSRTLKGRPEFIKIK